ncbi:membrane protein [Streptomyces sp. NRRL B-1568]|nr:membrane protein [Streptomyces sp. NRRL B-1568]
MEKSADKKSALKKAKGFKKSKAGTYLSIGTTLFGAVSVAKQAKKARGERDTLQLVDAVVSAAAIATGVALLVRELRRMNSDDVLAG